MRDSNRDPRVTWPDRPKKHAIGFLDDRVNPHLVRKPGVMRVQNLTPDGLVGVLKPCCTIIAARIRR